MTADKVSTKTRTLPSTLHARKSSGWLWRPAALPCLVEGGDTFEHKILIYSLRVYIIFYINFITKSIYSIYIYLHHQNTALKNHAKTNGYICFEILKTGEGLKKASLMYPLCEVPV